MEIIFVIHPIDCRKVIHIGGGYLHEDSDDSPYDVDNVNYCGKCHAYLPPREEVDIDI